MQITTTQLLNALAFIYQHQKKDAQKKFEYITCTVSEQINSLDDLADYDKQKMIELINETVHFKIINQALQDYRDQLMIQKEEGYTD